MGASRVAVGLRHILDQSYKDLVENNFPTDPVRPELVEGRLVEETFRSPFDKLRTNGRNRSSIKLNFGKLFVAKS